MAGNIQRRPDGKWRARYRDANHREHARHFSRKRDAEQWLASQEVAIARGEWVDPALSKITVGEWLPEWLALQVQLKPSTMVRYDVALRCQILPRFESRAPVPDYSLRGLQLGTELDRRGTCAGDRPLRPPRPVPRPHSGRPRWTSGPERRRRRTPPPRCGHAQALPHP